MSYFTIIVALFFAVFSLLRFPNTFQRIAAALPTGTRDSERVSETRHLVVLLLCMSKTPNRDGSRGRGRWGIFRRERLVKCQSWRRGLGPHSFSWRCVIIEWVKSLRERAVEDCLKKKNFFFWTRQNQARNGSTKRVKGVINMHWLLCLKHKIVKIVEGLLGVLLFCHSFLLFSLHNHHVVRMEKFSVPLSQSRVI